MKYKLKIRYIVLCTLLLVVWATQFIPAMGKIYAHSVYQIGYMAIGVGFLVGFAMRQGKGIRPIFGIIGAALALISCVMGDFFSIVGLVAKEYEVSFMDVLSDTSYSEVMSVVIENMASMTIVFYGIALYEGYKLSFSAQKAPEGGKI